MNTTGDLLSEMRISLTELKQNSHFINIFLTQNIKIELQTELD